MNEIQSAAATLGKLGGKSTSPAKQAASRENGRKGGRPLSLAAVEASPVGTQFRVLFAGDRPTGTSDSWQTWTREQIVMSGDQHRMEQIVRAK